jgi:hypothetical protein
VSERWDRWLARPWFLGLVILALVALIYAPLASAPQKVDIDAQLILPNLQATSGVSGYWHNLLTLKTYDIQPVRDATLVVDLLLLEHLGLNSFVWQNALWWTLGCWWVGQLLALLHPTLGPRRQALLTCLFAAYPLFAATVSWGMARKHILAFVFIMMATVAFIRWLRGAGRAWVFTLCYLFSVLSQPITVLWPAWAIVSLWVNRKSVRDGLVLLPGFGILLFTYVVNKQYYDHSEVFRLHYESKTAAALNLPDKLLGFGHYVYQTFLPYWPSVHYELGHPSVWGGIGLALGFYVFLRWRKVSLESVLVWGGFFLFPLAVVLINSHILSDNYLLVPAVGIFVLLAGVVGRGERTPRWILPVLLLFFSAYAMKESLLWRDPHRFADERGFQRRPNCSSAINLARKTYALGKKLSPENKQYLETHECFRVGNLPPAIMWAFLYLQSSILFYEDDLPLDDRIRSLEKLAPVNYYPNLMLAALLLRKGDEEAARRRIQDTIDLSSRILWPAYYEPAIALHLHPWCLREGWRECLEITAHFLRDPPTPYL